MIPSEARRRLAYNLASGERCPSGLRCRSRKAVWSKATAGSNPALSATRRPEGRVAPQPLDRTTRAAPLVTEIRYPAADGPLLPKT